MSKEVPTVALVWKEETEQQYLKHRRYQGRIRARGIPENIYVGINRERKPIGEKQGLCGEKEWIVGNTNKEIAKQKFGQSAVVARITMEKLIREGLEFEAIGVFGWRMRKIPSQCIEIAEDHTDPQTNEIIERAGETNQANSKE